MCPLIILEEAKPVEKTSLSDSLFHLYDFMWKRNKLVLWILVIEMLKKIISNAAGMSADNVLTWEIVLKISHFTLEVLHLLQIFNSWTISKWLLLSVDIPVAKGVYDCLWLNKDFGVTFLFASVFGSFPKPVRHTADKWWNLARLIFLICIFALLPWI